MRAHLALDYANYIPESSMTLNIAIRQKKKKEIKGIKIEKEDIKLLLFADDIMTYAGNLTESTKNKI